MRLLSSRLIVEGNVRRGLIVDGQASGLPVMTNCMSKRHPSGPGAKPTRSRLRRPGSCHFRHLRNWVLLRATQCGCAELGYDRLLPLLIFVDWGRRRRLASPSDRGDDTLGWRPSDSIFACEPCAPEGELGCAACGAARCDDPACRVRDDAKSPFVVLRSKNCRLAGDR